MDRGITIQFIKAGISIFLGILGIVLPRKYNPFQFKKHGLGAILAQKIPQQIQDQIPKVIGCLLVITGVVILLLTVILGSISV